MIVELHFLDKGHSGSGIFNFSLSLLFFHVEVNEMVNIDKTLIT